MRWRTEDITFTMLDDLTSGSVMTIEITTPDGILRTMFEPAVQGATLVLRGFHVSTVVPRLEVGPVNLRMLMGIVLERMDYDEIVIEGAVRTTGANPSHRPRPVRFARRRGPAPVPEPAGR